MVCHHPWRSTSSSTRWTSGRSIVASSSRWRTYTRSAIPWRTVRRPGTLREVGRHVELRSAPAGVNRTAPETVVQTRDGVGTDDPSSRQRRGREGRGYTGYRGAGGKPRDVAPKRLVEPRPQSVLP